MNKTILTMLLSLAFLPLGAQAEPAPRLVLQITVDQLRGDLPIRSFERFGEVGFRYIMGHGAVFTDALFPTLRN